MRRHRLGLRSRMALLAATAVAAAVALASSGAWLLTRAELFQQVDAELTAQLRAVEDLPHSLDDRPSEAQRRFVPHPVPAFTQIVEPDGAAVRPDGQAALPVSEQARRLAAGGRGLLLEDAVVEGVPLRVASRSSDDGRLVQVARPVTDVYTTLHQLALLLGLVAAAGIGVAALAGHTVAKAGLLPVRRVAQAAEEVARTMDLRAAIPVEGDDDIARVARSVNHILTALDTARDQQRQLVEDAGHELRTPLTSLRANVELLERAGSDQRLTAEDRDALLRDVRLQIVELGDLVGEVIDLAREERQAETPVALDLRQLVSTAVARARRHFSGTRFSLHADDLSIVGRRGALDRAVGNLLDNAAKFGPVDGSVEVVLTRSADGRQAVVEVHDRGPGIPVEGREKVFQRFYRTPEARAVSGSGLGLAIASQAATHHGGRLSLLPRKGGGTVARLVLPLSGAVARDAGREDLAQEDPGQEDGEQGDGGGRGPVPAILRHPPSAGREAVDPAPGTLSDPLSASHGDRKDTVESLVSQAEAGPADLPSTGRASPEKELRHGEPTGRSALS